MSPPKILLIMMIKNESKIIERAINSALPIIDGICVLDTGSTDNTVSVVNDIIDKLKTQKSGFIGKVYNKSFVNFGVSRSESFNFAKELLLESNWALENTFGLLLDADMVLKIENAESVRNNIGKYDNGLLYQVQHQYKYFNIRLIKMSLKWECIGVTHEFWNAEEAGSCVFFEDNIWIDDISDGGCKSDKFERDIRLLEDALKDDPLNSRYYFFLGQSYMCINKLEKSIECYKKSTELGSTCETHWFSLCMISKQYILLGKLKEASDYCELAVALKPNRSEPLYEMTAHYLSVSDFEKVDEYVKRGVNIPFPERDIIYVDAVIYGYGFKMLEFESMVRRKDKFSSKDFVTKFNNMRNAKLHDKKVYMDDLLWKFAEKLKVSRELALADLSIGDAGMVYDSVNKKFVILKGGNRLVKADNNLCLYPDVEIHLPFNIDSLFEHHNSVWYTRRIPEPEIGTVNTVSGCLSPDSITTTVTFLGNDVPPIVTAFQRVMPVTTGNNTVTGLLKVVKPGSENTLFMFASRSLVDGTFRYSAPFYFEDINAVETCQSICSCGEENKFSVVYRSNDVQKVVIVEPEFM